VKVGVFNKFWSTMGGGEKYAASMAVALGAGHQVTLLGTDDIDIPLLEERLQVDLTGVSTTALGVDPGAASEASADFDLFINASYGSDEPNRAAHGLYVVYFPSGQAPGIRPLDRRAVRVLDPLARPHGAVIRWGRGFHARDSGAVFSWTAGRAVLYVVADDDLEIPLHLSFGGHRPSAAGPTTVHISVEGAPVATVRVEPGHRRASVEIPVRGRGSKLPVAVEITADTFTPAALGLGDDQRELGVPLTRAAIGQRFGGARSLGQWGIARLAQRVRPNVNLLQSLRFLDTYDHLVSISDYTTLWTKRFWDRDSVLLHPPVTPQPGGDELVGRQPLILSVGRFFAPEHGHSKKQLEMVKAFRQVCDAGLEGWEYHLVGGCKPEDEHYLDDVRAAAAGLPVVFHIGATGSELRDLYTRASLFWHATGLGEDPSQNPVRFEHFGITTVEAMSAGVVPIVIGMAGQLEVLRDGVEGFHFSTADELVSRTRQVAGDDALRLRLAAAAVVRARQFAPEEFARRLDEIVAGLGE
jgi:glycosyltransferase involved in cell wall biosynthesis